MALLWSQVSHQYAPFYSDHPGTSAVHFPYDRFSHGRLTQFRSVPSRR